MIEDLSLRSERRYNITATDVATLFGLNPYESPASLLEKKLNPQPIVSNHLRRGKLKEPSVIEAFNLDMGLTAVRHEGGTLTLPGHRIAATPDAYLLGSKTVVECKSVTSRNFDKWYTNIPTQYHLQVMMQMLVVGSEEGFIGALEEGDPYECEYRFIAWKMRADEQIFLMIKEEVQRFWAHVDAGTLFRVKSSTKARMKQLLEENKVLAYASPRPEKEEETREEEISRILSVFK